MLARKPVFPHVIEMNYQAGQRLGCNVYLVFDETEWVLIDVGFRGNGRRDRRADSAARFSALELQDADRHARRRRPHSGPGQDQAGAQDHGHRPSHWRPSRWPTGDKIKTFAEIAAQNIHLDMPPVKLDTLVDEGDVITRRRA